MKTEADNGMFKSAGMKRANARDQQVSKGKQFGIGNFFSWAMKKYPKLTLGQLELKMPSLEREYAQEKAMRKAEPEMKPSVNPHEGADLNRLRELSGLDTEDDDLEEKYQYENTAEKLKDMIRSHQSTIDNEHPEEIQVDDHQNAIAHYEDLLQQHKETGADTFEAPFGGDTAWREEIQQEMEEIGLYKPSEAFRGIDSLPEELNDIRRRAGLEVEEGKLPAGLQAYQDKKNGKKDDADKDEDKEVDEDKDEDKEEVDEALRELQRMSGIVVEGKVKDVITDAQQMSKQEFDAKYKGEWDYAEIMAEYPIEEADEQLAIGTIVDETIDTTIDQAMAELRQLAGI